MRSIDTTEYDSAIKKNKIMPCAATWMDLEILLLSQSDKDKNQRNIPYMWNLKYDTNEPIYKTDTDSDTENQLRVTEGEGRGEGHLRSLG